MNPASKMEETLRDLQKKLGKKQSFESAATSIASFIKENYACATPAEQDLMYTTVCRVATLLQSRYSASCFWLAGLKVFEEAEKVFVRSSEMNHIKNYISRVHSHLNENQQREEFPSNNSLDRDSRFLFEGQLTPEAPAPEWLRSQSLFTALGMSTERSFATTSSERQPDEFNASENSTQVHNEDFISQVLGTREEILNNLGADIEIAIENALQEVGSEPPRPPPASKRVIESLPIVNITDDVLENIGKETECAVCREHLCVSDKMQELPCKHLFHPDCLKPWMDEHNSCPICRYELETDDAAYELKKEREKEAEEERKGAANAIRGGEYMYV
eukprot:TRINITY_DN16145_c0_g1_i1.p1 TRINITY_DN16145_c0_g1~~TRINITY_DN16145_c0_g1_i1.p1  ORF type:complete len:333 (-),score=88.08 TRINITY_DN16145_c0_g1_i1:299-1297(-)